jgi:hypothetical protein
MIRNNRYSRDCGNHATRRTPPGKPSRFGPLRHGRNARPIGAFVALFVVALLAVFPPSALARCGVERWAVKTGTDSDASLVNLAAATPTTLATMRSWSAPQPLPSNSRLSPQETTVWVVDTTLTVYKIEDDPNTGDSDYHLVLSDDAGSTVIAEIPFPDCVGTNSPFRSRIAAARAAFDARFTATGQFQTANIPVRVTGVGFFDFHHNQRGVAPNAIELHPVLDIVFNPPTPVDFQVSVSPASVSLAPGLSGQVAVAVTPSQGIGPISLEASGAPPGATATFAPNPAPSGQSTLTLEAASAPPGQYTLTIRGTAPSGVTKSTNLGMAVTAPTPTADFSLSVSPTAVRIAQGGQTTAAVNTVTSGGFNSSITLTTTVLPNGVTATLSPSTLAAPGAGTSTIVLIASPHATPGPSDLTVTATGGGRTHSTAIAIQVDVVPSGTLVQNGDFERGDLVGWTVAGAVPPTVVTTQRHGGTRAVLLGTAKGTEGTGDSSVTQAIILPRGARGTLSFWHFPGTTDTVRFDWQEMEIRNAGGVRLTSVFRHALDTRAWLQETVDITPYLGQTIQLYFNVHQDGANDATYMYVDDVTITVVPEGPPGGIVVFSDDVEQGNKGWTIRAQQGSLRWAIEATGDVASGSHRWRSNPGTHYNNNTDSSLMSPPLDMSGATEAQLSFSYKLETEPRFDIFTVDISGDGGSTWKSVATHTGSSQGWVKTAIDLREWTGNANIRARFRLTSDGSVTGWGVALDDIAVTKR